ncbi:2-oxo-4-hydroxy-4-carboxy-5-ureidoimidazoline decarboxylase [Aestuariispira insulae]|uniref:2-oxo-4-hydroxy-4-carboxy-5-ureidoimidazoline decarboxylase n=1 Tax=Aestuariispira insulae TaxID=1461337 RepID=A0A3D9HWH8_9PROT|nr:2-oxo-4-hydroxy-4-carboxy-5-ureidoimidazoline decarboxylase [Aestuariispira insulae]RED53863.1 OHCU decarboxylase [Aestuariispira insulae]
MSGTQFKCEPSNMDRDQFLAQFGGVYEHSPWVADRAYEQGLSDSDNQVENLSDRMAAVLADASPQEQLDLINAHPDLAGKAALAGELTDSSTDEQSRAGLSQCTPEELARFHELNNAYKEKFGFPFIMAVRNANKALILEGFETRIHNDTDTEFATALAEINKIARLRMMEM